MCTGEYPAFADSRVHSFSSLSGVPLGLPILGVTISVCFLLTAADFAGSFDVGGWDSSGHWVRGVESDFAGMFKQNGRTCLFACLSVCDLQVRIWRNELG